MDKLDIPMLQADIPKFYYRMEDKEKQWWTAYLSGLKKMKEVRLWSKWRPLGKLLSENISYIRMFW